MTSAPTTDWASTTASLSPLIRAQADEVERTGMMTAAVVEALSQTGLFWMMSPTRYGGYDADIVTSLRAIEALSVDDGSVGWSFMANMAGGAAACAYLPEEGLAEIFSGPRRPIFAGMLSPKGTAVPTGDRFTLTGRFQFGSGIAEADWVGAGAFVRENGKVRSKSDGAPDIRTFFVPRDRVRLLGNWDVIGLVGTGSVDYEIVEHVIEARFCFELPDPQSRLESPSSKLGLAPTGGAGHGAVATGIALRALEEIARIAESKRRTAMSPLGDQQLFRHGFAVHDAALGAARALFFQTFGDAVAEADAHGAVSRLTFHRMRQVVTYATNVSADAVRWAYGWGGSHSLRNPSPLGRCIRDITAATQHLFVDQNTLADAGPFLMASYLGELTSEVPAPAHR